MKKEYRVIWTAQFKREYKLAMKRRMNIALLDSIIKKLAAGETLPKNTKTMRFLGILKIFANVILHLTGCLYIKSLKTN